ncbi:hypothetical protein Prudu_010953, partial [Prunus dulcis]
PQVNQRELKTVVNGFSIHHHHTLPHNFSLSLLPKSPQIPSFKNTTKHCSARRVRLVSCNATVNEDQQPPPGNLDRRRMFLLASEGYTVACPVYPQTPSPLLTQYPPRLNPMRTRRLTKRRITHQLLPAHIPQNHRLEAPPPPSRLRVRPAAQTVDQSYIDKYSKAIALMKALPDDDPRNFTQQANSASQTSSSKSTTAGSSSPSTATTYISTKNLGQTHRRPDVRFAVLELGPPAGMQLPALYANPDSPLYDELPAAAHQPPTLVDLDFNGTDEKVNREARVNTNLKIMYRQMVSNAKKPLLFFGWPYRAGTEADPEPVQLRQFRTGRFIYSREITPSQILRTWGVLFSSQGSYIFAHTLQCGSDVEHLENLGPKKRY